jgi:autotransporter strand-loop-strand O-heptosyltransferase
MTKLKNAPFFEDLRKRKSNFVERDPEILISFNGGARVDIRGYSKKKYRVEFWIDKKLEYFSEIGCGYFSSPNKKYFLPWKVKVYEGKTLVKEKNVELKGSKVHVFLDSSSLGDTLAWMPQIERFRKLTGCKVCLTTFFNELFEKQYPEIEWNYPGTALKGIEYTYYIGYHIGEDRFDKTPKDPREIPLARVPCEVLGIPYEETRPAMKSGFKRLIKEKYVCLATMSTAGAKLWHRENGWEDVVEHLTSKGYKVVVMHKEETSLKGVIDMTGDRPLEERMALLEHCDLFVGLGSGLSWLAWAMKRPVVLISGFSDAFAEFQLDCERVINKDVCNSCWNDTSVRFDKGDWNWCPRLKDTERQFECTKKISAIRVIAAIEKAISS